LRQLIFFSGQLVPLSFLRRLMQRIGTSCRKL
jgi:hypothetical protein